MAGTKISQLQDLDIITGLENVVLQKDTANNKCSLNKIKEFAIKDTQLKEDGKGLSTNDFTNEDKLKLDSALTQIKTINGESLIGSGDIKLSGVDNNYVIDFNKLILLVQNPDGQNNESITDVVGTYDTLRQALFINNKIMVLSYDITGDSASSKSFESSLSISGGNSTITVKFLAMELTIVGNDNTKEWISINLTSNELADKRYVDRNLSYKSNKKVKTNLAGPYNNLTLTDSACYNLVDIDTSPEINISLTPPDTVNGNPAIGEYMLTFDTKDNIPTITLPNNVKWIGDHVIEANKSYILAITDNFAVLGGA